MLTQSKMYALFNKMQRKDSTAVVKEYANVLNWTSEENVLDVGCGTGDVTLELILPLLSESSQLTGLDISPHMIEFARYSNKDPRVKFIIADFGSEHITDILPELSFSKIFSFYALHWIKDQRRVASNLASLLKPGGEVLAIIMANTCAFAVYEALSEMDKWKPYMQDVDKYISPYFNVPNIEQVVTDTFAGTGLIVRTCEKRECSFLFPSFSCQLKSFEAVNPFISRVPDNLKQEFTDTIKQLVINYQHIPSDNVEDMLPTIYELVILHLQKL